MRIGSLLLLLILISSSGLMADKNTQNIMRQVVENYAGLIPYIYGDEAQDQKDIAKKLKALKNAFNSSKHDQILKASNFSPIASSMKESLDDIHSTYRATNDHFTKYRLKKLSSLCVACHTQLPKERFTRVHNRYKEVTRQYVKDHEDKAYISYFFRDYSKAAYHLKRDFEQSPSIDKLSRIMKVYLVSKNDKDEANNYLIKTADSPQIPTRIKAIAKSWSDELQTGFKRPTKKLNKQAEIKEIIKEQLVPYKNEFQYSVHYKKVVTAYQIQRILYNYMSYHPNGSLNAEILYWLGILESKTKNINLYNLGEMFLEQCITQYPEHHISMKCYQEYEDSIKQGFTGSSGLNLPQELQEKLKRYKKLIKSSSQIGVY